MDAECSICPVIVGRQGGGGGGEAGLALKERHARSLLVEVLEIAEDISRRYLGQMGPDAAPPAASHQHGRQHACRMYNDVVNDSVRQLNTIESEFRELHERCARQGAKMELARCQLAGQRARNRLLEDRLGDVRRAVEAGDGRPADERLRIIAEILDDDDDDEGN